MILEEYRHFNAEEFIKSLKGLRKTRDKLKEELESISELPSVDNKTGVRGSEISDLTGRQALRRIEIESEIAEIDLCLSAYDYAKSRLSPVDREVIELFFEPKKPIWREIDDYTSKHYICRDKLYKMRKLALAEIDRIINEKYLK